MRPEIKLVVEYLNANVQNETSFKEFVSIFNNCPDIPKGDKKLPLSL